MTSRLGLVAGGGALPAAIISHCDGAGRPLFVLGLDGYVDDPRVRDRADAWVRLGAGEKAMSLLRQAGVRDLVLAGYVRRPSLLSLRPDGLTFRLLTRIGMRMLGDDGLLSAVVRELEQTYGFNVVSPQQVLEDLLGQARRYTRAQPDPQAESDIRRGVDVARALGAADVGQAVVIQQGLVLAVEAIEGTDAMIARAGELRREGEGGVLVKLCKPQQDRRVDLPTIGPRTITNAARAGLRGIAIEAGGALLVEEAETVRLADEAGLFIVAVERDG